MSANTLEFLVICRDKIGDLVCTTPLMHALRERCPGVQIDLLVNTHHSR